MIILLLLGLAHEIGCSMGAVISPFCGEQSRKDYDFIVKRVSSVRPVRSIRV